MHLKCESSSVTYFFICGNRLHDFNVQRYLAVHIHLQISFCCLSNVFQ